MSIDPGLRAAYNEMAAAIPDFTPPTLEFYDDLHGVGGMFVPDDWTILVGMKDMADIVDRLIASDGRDLAPILREHAVSLDPPRQNLRKILIGAAIGRCMAHELGHAMIALGWKNPFAPDDEAGADYYAGKLDAVRNRDARLGAYFFKTIGCTGPTCTHPPPASRRKAYVAGYRQQAGA